MYRYTHEYGILGLYETLTTSINGSKSINYHIIGKRVTGSGEQVLNLSHAGCGTELSTEAIVVAVNRLARRGYQPLTLDDPHFLLGNVEFQHINDPRNPTAYGSIPYIRTKNDGIMLYPGDRLCVIVMEPSLLEFYISAAQLSMANT